MNTPYTPLLYSKTGVYRGIHFFLIFALKHRLWVLVLMCTRNQCFEQKYENSKKNQMKFVIFTAVKNRCILHGRVFVMTVEIPSALPTSTLGCFPGKMDFF